MMIRDILFWPAVFTMEAPKDRFWKRLLVVALLPYTALIFIFGLIVVVIGEMWDDLKYNWRKLAVIPFLPVLAPVWALMYSIGVIVWFFSGSTKIFKICERIIPG